MDNQIRSNYIYDLDEIKNFIFEENNGRTSDVEITESKSWDSEGKIDSQTRITREVKSSDSNRQTIRYEIIKMFMDILDNIEIDQSISPLSLGEKMVINTMGSYGLIKEIKE